ncbi:MAG: alpha-hydroxy-acid oxidizing protein [Comamonadaceae bacterium]|nr:MAG: alpha-hydroxy-acid oxidizing protein [Comamonadaceae bacterium]
MTISQAPALGTIPPGVVTLDDHETAARSRLDDNAWAYFSGGAGDETTLRANRAAWNGINLNARVLQDLAGIDTQTSLLGSALAHPILLAPVAFQKLAHPDGETATAFAAAAQDAGMVLSTQSSVRLEDVAHAYLSTYRRPEGGAHSPLWFQLYVQPDRGFTRELVQRAEKAGFTALVVTVDAATSGVRDRERRAGFQLPPGISAVNLEGMHPPSPRHVNTGESRLFDGLRDTALTWKDLEWLQSQTRLPVLVKGILHPEDARQSVREKVAGIIVSNHGGRTLDTLPPTAAVLPRIAHAVAGELPILADGGIRRGTDVLKAIAMGASAVLVGRPCVYGLANAGALGVAHVIRLLRDELEIAMALTGCRDLQALPEDLLFTA